MPFDGNLEPLRTESPSIPTVPVSAPLDLVSERALRIDVPASIETVVERPWHDTPSELESVTVVMRELHVVPDIQPCRRSELPCRALNIVIASVALLILSPV